MKTVQSVFKEQIVPIQSNIHDCVDTGTLVTLSSGVRTLYTNDKLTYEYKNGETDLWDSVNSIVKDSILDSKVDIVIGGTHNAPNANTRLKVELVIDVGGTGLSEILVKTRTLEIVRNGVDINADMAFHVYNGAAALADGFKIYLTAENGDVGISDKAMLVRV